MLAEHLVGLALEDPVILALPRGGVPVAAEVAAALGAPFEVFVVRKIGLPWQPEFGIGAVAEGDEPLFEEAVLIRLGLTRQDLADAVARERRELASQVIRYRGDRPLPAIGGRNVVLVDDGLATGVTARAALQVLKRASPARLVLAVPVCAPGSASLFPAVADDVVRVLEPDRFRAVGAWYERFEQTTDAQVLALLAASRQ